MQTFPTLETNRLLLTELQSQDIPRIVEYASDQEITQFTLNIPHPYTEQDAIFWLNQSYQGFKDGHLIVFAIRLKPHLEFIGGIGLTMAELYHRAEIGYWVAKPFWNKGYASEALAVVLKHGFQKLNLHKIYATHLDANRASGKVMLKNGMTKEGILKDHIYKNGKYYDLVQYGLISDQ